MRFSGLLGGLQEALAVHRHEIVFANDRFAALVGATNAAELQGRSLADIVHADYQELIADHLRRCLAGEPTLEHLELEMQPLRQQTARVELSAVQIEYQGGPALLLTLIEMSPRTAVASLPRARPTAWATLDSLGEGVLTTDVSGRIDYLNQAAEQLIGIPASDALGKAFADIITLVDETDRRSLGDPVRQCLDHAIARDGRSPRYVDLARGPGRALRGAHGIAAERSCGANSSGRRY